MTRILSCLVILLGLLTIDSSAYAQKKAADPKNLLSQEFNLVPQHSKDTQYFEMESRLMNYALDGTRLGTDVYHLFLRCVPSVDASKGDQYTCLKFTAQINGAPEVTIPTLTNWQYLFSLTPDAKNEKGEVLGIDHAKFENIKDANGNAIPAGNTYHIYNAFIDFHSMYVFCENSGAGNGIQNLKHLGDKVIHAAANSQAPVNLGSQVAEGSYFKNGEVTLLFKGMSLVNEKTCALIEYDSGESSFTMKMKPMPSMEVNTKGSSHYWGDIYKDIASGWFQKATLHEMVVSETNVPGMSKINSVIERNISIKNIARPVL
ncbi:MAG: hypothetical protein ACXVLT_15735 [Flavisolibacter sp.]